LKIAVLDTHEQSYNQIAKLTLHSKIKYCEKYNYTFIHEVFNITELKDYFPTWGRVLKIQKYLPNFDYLLYLDTDTIITNYQIPIENYLQPCLAVSHIPNGQTGQPAHLSTSAMLFKNCPWSFQMLEYWWTLKQFNHQPYKSPPNKIAAFPEGGKFYEQSAFHYLYDHTDFADNITIMPHCWLNKREVNYKKNDHLIHFAGQDDKLNRIKRFMSKL